MVSGLFLVVFLLLAGSAYGVECFGKIEFKDTEYGHNYDSYWSVWRKPITAEQAASIKRATVALLDVPADMQRVDSVWREAARAGTRWRGAHLPLLEMRPIQRKPPEKAYRHEIRQRNVTDPIHEVVLLISPANRRYANMITYKPRDLVTQPLVEMAAPKRKPGQNWDVRLIITQQGRLAGHDPRWEKFWMARGKPKGFNNFQNDWRVAMCRAES